MGSNSSDSSNASAPPGPGAAESSGAAGDGGPAPTLLLTPSLGAVGGGNCFSRSLDRPASDTNALLVSYRRSPDELLGAWRRHVGRRPANFGVIAVGTETRSTRAVAAADADGAARVDEELVTTVESAQNLTELDIAVSLYLEEWAGTGESHVCVESVSALLSAFPLETVFRFLHVLIARLRQSGASAHFHLDPLAHDEETVNTLRPLFDTVCDPRATADDGTVDLPEAELRDLLRVPRRQAVLEALRSADAPMAVRELAERLAGDAHDGSAGPAEDDVERVHISLHHTHLPKLADAGLVTTSEDGKRVDLAVSRSAADDYLGLV